MDKTLDNFHVMNEYVLSEKGQQLMEYFSELHVFTKTHEVSSKREIEESHFLSMIVREN